MNDLASSAYYAGGESESFIGKSAPWFILGVMLFSYCVRAIYVESCSMFVRGGVYRVVKEALGGTLAKFSVSALMFDYVLTGPISGVSAGQYLAGFLNELFAYFHLGIVISENTTAAVFAILITLYFWQENIKGIPESSDKALKIMKVTTAMVVILIVWCSYTIWIRGAHLPPFPWPSNIRLDSRSLGWLSGNQIVKMIPAIAVFVGIGHSVLAMSGEESLAQVYREIEAPKLPNLKKAGLIIFIYSLLFTSLVSFFAVMIIPDGTRGQYLENLIGGLSMNLIGPFSLRLVFHVFVVVVGTLILAGAVNTAIVGSNGVLNRVSEDGVLTDWFRQPHRKFGTSHRIINMVVGFQILTIIASRGDVTFLANLYAFGVIWSFTMQGIAVLGDAVHASGRPRIPRAAEFPVVWQADSPGVGADHAGALPDCGRKPVHETERDRRRSGLFVCHVRSIHGFGARYAPESRRGARGNGPVQCRGARGTLAPGLGSAARQHSGSRQQLSRALPSAGGSGPRQNRAPRRRRASHPPPSQVHIRIKRARSGATVWKRRAILVHKSPVAGGEARQDRSFGRCLANDMWSGILNAAVKLQCSSIVLGRSTKLTLPEQAREIGLAWEQLEDPRPQFNLEIFSPGGEREYFLLGPHAPNLTSNEVRLVHRLWLRFSDLVAPDELHHHDVVHFALDEVLHELQEGKEADVVARLKEHINRNKAAKSNST